jgi:hypothetical protein
MSQITTPRLRQAQLHIQTTQTSSMPASSETYVPSPSRMTREPGAPRMPAKVAAFQISFTPNSKEEPSANLSRYSEKKIKAWMRSSTHVPKAPRVATFDHPSVVSDTKEGDGNFATTSPVSSTWGSIQWWPWQEEVAEAAMCCSAEKEDFDKAVMLPKCTLFTHTRPKLQTLNPILCTHNVTCTKHTHLS